MKRFCLVIFFLFLGGSSLCASPLDPQGNAKITRNEAQHIALKRHKGARVTAAKLETIEGKLIWSIDLAQGEHPARVTVDAMSGRIVSVK